MYTNMNTHISKSITHMYAITTTCVHIPVYLQYHTYVYMHTYIYNSCHTLNWKTYLNAY